MKTSTATQKLPMAIALAAISASTVAISKAEAAIIQVSPGSLQGTGLINFAFVQYPPPDPVYPIPGNIPGNNYNTVFFAQDAGNPSVGVNIAERFVGQSLSYLPPIAPATGDFDYLGNSASNLLALEVGNTNQNITVWTDQKYLSGLGRGSGAGGFPDLNAIGEGSIAILFPRQQSEFRFLLQGATTGSVTLNFFRRDGSVININPIVIDSNNPFGYGNKNYGFQATDGDKIWGVSIINYDPDGIAIDNIRYDNPGPPEPPPSQDVPEASSVLGLLGIGVLGGGLKLKSKLKP